MQNNCCVIHFRLAHSRDPTFTFKCHTELTGVLLIRPGCSKGYTHLHVTLSVNWQWLLKLIQSTHDWVRSQSKLHERRAESLVFLSRLVLCRKMTTAGLKQCDKDKRSIRLMCAHTRKRFTWRTWFTFRAREFSETSFCSLPAALSSPRHQLSWSYETRCCSRSMLDVTEGFLFFHREKEFVRGQGVFFHVGSKERSGTWEVAGSTPSPPHRLASVWEECPSSLPLLNGNWMKKFLEQGNPSFSLLRSRLGSNKGLTSRKKLTKHNSVPEVCHQTWSSVRLLTSLTWKSWRRGRSDKEGFVSQQSSATFKCCRNFVRRCTYVGFASRQSAQIHMQPFSTISFKPCDDNNALLSIIKQVLYTEDQDPCCCELTVLTTGLWWASGLLHHVIFITSFHLLAF